MDVPVRTLKAWAPALGGIVLFGLALRLIGIHDPVLDHPAWRQGDTAAIARNFALLNFNIFYPQADYNGPPPNYVELELQIVPYLAAIGYKIFGVHEVFGRLVSIAFSLGTIVVLGYFARALFASTAAGLAAALLYAIMPGSVYYGRTFTPDGAMAFFLTAAIFAAWRRFDVVCGALLALAFLAKPVALVAVLPILALGYVRKDWRSVAVVAPALAVLYLYLHYAGSHAEWHWASGITQKHVVPSLLHSLVTPSAMLAKLHILFLDIGRMLATTILGPAGLTLAIAGFVLPPRSRANALLYGWLVAGVLYAFAVVTVERVDYYLYPLLPLAALAGGAFLAQVFEWRVAPWPALALGLLVVVATNEAQILPYYHYKHDVYREARRLNTTLAQNALVVMGHYDPAILYYINRKGWEEDPYLWRAFDEQSAIAKGARYFIAVERNRLARNVELAAWLERFPRLPDGLWPVYETDYAKVQPGAEERWRRFREREHAGTLPRAGGRVPTTNGQLIDPTLPAPALTPAGETP